MSIFLTIFTGVSVYVLGQIIMKFFIEPVHEFQRIIADVSHSLIEYKNVYSNPGVTGIENENIASDVFRKLSSQLNARAYLIPCYDRTAKLFGLPPRINIIKSTKYLIGLSNGVFKSAERLATKNAEKADFICKLLNIYTLEENSSDAKNS